MPTVLLILSQFTIVGTSLMALYPFRPYRWKSGPKLWDFDRMIICLVSNGSNLQVRSCTDPRPKTSLTI